MTVAQLLKHDFNKGSLSLYDTNGNRIYYETSSGYRIKREFDSNGNQTYIEDSHGYWEKYEYDTNGNEIYFEESDGYWNKREYDSNGNQIYFENSIGDIIDDRPKKETCEGKVVEIDGKQYRLTEV